MLVAVGITCVYMFMLELQIATVFVYAGRRCLDIIGIFIGSTLQAQAGSLKSGRWPVWILSLSSRCIIDDLWNISYSSHGIELRCSDAKSNKRNMWKTRSEPLLKIRLMADGFLQPLLQSLIPKVATCVARIGFVKEILSKLFSKSKCMFSL